MPLAAISRPAALRARALVGFAAAVAGIGGLLGRGEILARHPLPIAVQIVAAGLMIWARLTFGRRSFHAGAVPTAGGLVTSGPYRYWRHPIYAAIIYFVAAAAADHWGAMPAALAAVVVIGLVLRMAAEERFLTATYPEYEVYAQHTGRILPGVV